MSTCTENSVIEDARQLSSGTMATMVRQYGLLFDYQQNQCDYLDAVQSRFVVFCGTKLASDCKTWQDAMAKYAHHVHTVHKSWTCGYQGSTWFKWQGKEYECCWSKDKNQPWNGDYFETGLKYHVGTVYRHYGMSEGFPPDEVICCFYQLVPLAATFDRINNEVKNWKYIYDDRFGPPKQIWGQRGWDKDHLQAALWDDWDKIDYEDSSLQYRRKHYR